MNQSKRRTFRFNKLGRYGIYQRWLKEGVVPHLIPLNEESYQQCLRDKLQEETTEVKNAHNIDDLKEELGDVLEVINAFAMSLGCTLADIEKLRAEKYALKGGFEKAIFVDRVEFPEGHPNIDYCLKHPDRYPEIKD